MNKLKFTHLPGFAKYLLDNRLDEFVKLQLSLSREVEIPLLKLLEQVPEEQLLELSKFTSAELLKHAVNNTLSLQIQESVKQWTENLLPVMLTREQVAADDITLGSLVRKRAMLRFLPEYAKDVPAALSIAAEIAEFHQASEAVLFETFVNIQQAQLNKYNAALKASEELYKEAQALTHIGNWTWYVETGKVVWSDEMYRIYGLEPQSEEITFDRFVSLMHPEDRGWRIEQIQTAVQTFVSPEYTLRVIRPNGQLVILEGKGEVKVKDSKAYKMNGTCRDITTEYNLRKELLAEKLRLAEANTLLEQKNQELERSNKELTAFTYVASHDLQEPLRKIMMFSQMFMEREGMSMTARGKDLFTKIHGGAQNMKRLIEDLLSYSRVQSYNDTKTPVDLNAIVNEVRNGFNDAPGVNVTIQAQKLPVVQGIPFQLYQLFENIIGNAVKYARADAPPRIILNSQIVSGKDIERHNTDVNASYYKIDFVDNGIGFEQEYAVKIFEIFQRLHKKGEYTGTGIGLAICKKIVQNHEGFIEASSTPGQGAEFTVYLPV